MFESKRLRKFNAYPLSPHKVWDSDRNILKLDWNESDKNLNDQIKLELITKITKINFNWYPNMYNKELYSKLSKFLNISEKLIIPTSSSDYAHELIARTFIDEGDKVSIVHPTYDNFRSTFQSFGAKINYFNLDSRFKLDYSEYDKHLKKNDIKVAYICNPNNPTGTIHKSKDLIKLINLNLKKLTLNC